MAGHGFMDDLFFYCDVVDGVAVEIAQQVIMVAGDVKDLGAVFCLFKNRVYYPVVDFRPMPASLCLEQVKNITDQIEIFRFRIPKEIEQLPALQAAGTKVNV